MTGPGSDPVAERYEGPPATLRPAPWQVLPVPPPWAPQHPWAPMPYAGGPPPGWYPPPPPPVVRWAPPPGTPPHDEPRTFLRAMRSRDWAWWRPVLGLLLLAAVYVALSALTAVAGLLGFLASGADPGTLPDLGLDGFTDPWCCCS